MWKRNMIINNVEYSIYMKNTLIFYRYIFSCIAELDFEYLIFAASHTEQAYISQLTNIDGVQ